uniref:Uncharacterized protein n=1 Tax=Sipha flava TaxID=143950 RepID=A0A2S2R0A2_9HEMI
MSGSPNTPLSLEQVADLLRQAAAAVVSTNHHPWTAETVMAMREGDLRNDPVLGAAFQRGWDACGGAVHQAVRRPAGVMKRLVKLRPTPGTGKPPSATKPKPAPATGRKPGVPTVDGKIPPLPNEWSQAEKDRVLRFNPRSGFRPLNVAGGSRPLMSQVPTGTEGAPGKARKTPVKPATASEGQKATGKMRKWERFLRIKAAKKAKKDRPAPTSQQHRLAKHPVPLEATTASIDTPAKEEPMEIDVGSTGDAATPGTSRDEVAVGKSGRDVIDVYLESPLPPLPGLEDPITFGTPLTSPGRTP